MKRIIFTTFDDIHQDDDRWNVNFAANNLVAEYFDRLVENKKEYAEKIGADFKFYHNTMKDFEVGDELEFTKTNLYKHHVMSELADEYDEVMYVDMDVVFNTDKNVFEELDLSQGIHIKDQDRRIENKNVEEVLFSEIGLRNPTLKYHITKDLLGGKDNHVMNTGIMIAKSEHIKQIKYVERMPDAISKINKIKDDIKQGTGEPAFIRMHYYANNESIFSYILEEFEVPYVIMDSKWHYILDHFPDDVNIDDIEIIHFINKKFNAYFNDKKKAIFSIYIEIPDERLDNPSDFKDDDVPKSKRTQERLANYADRLIENHKEYANAVGAEYLHFGRDEQYEEFYNRFSFLSEYNVVNLYKIWLLDKLTYDYDLVMYIDYDVYFRQMIDVFNYVPAEYCVCCDTETAKQVGVEKDSSLYYHWYRHDFRNPEAKYWNCHALLTEDDLDPENNVFNTGVVIASRNVMEQLDYFSDIEEVLEKMTEVKEFSMYPEQIRDSFGWDNETIFSYKVEKNEVPVFNIPKWWHHKNHYWSKNSFVPGHRDFKKAKHEFEASVRESDSVIIHFISKNFGLVFEE